MMRERIRLFLSRPLNLGQSLMLATGLYVLLFAAAYLFAYPFYAGGDEDAMRAIAEGKFSPLYGPHPYLMFINVLLGYPIAALYRLLPDIYWYDIAQHLLLASGLIAIFSVLLRHIAGAWARFSTLLTLALLALYFFIQVHFTSISDIVMLGGWMLLLDALCSKKPVTARYLCGGLLCVLASLVRYETYWPMLIIFAAASAPLVLVARPSWRALLGAVLTLGVSSLLAYSAMLWHRELVYPWVHDFWVFNGLRNMPVDYFNYAQEADLPALVKSADWTLPQLNLLRNWFFLNPDYYSIKTLQRLVETMHARGVHFHLEPMMWWAMKPYLHLLLLCSLLSRSLLQFLYLLFLAGLYSAVLFATHVVYKIPPDHVYVPLAFTMIALGIYGPPPGKRPRLPGWTKIRMVVPVIAALLVIDPTIRTSNKVARDRVEANAADIAAYTPLLPPNAILLTWPMAFPASRPFTPLLTHAGAVQINSALYTPTLFSQQTLAHYGLGTHPERTLCSRPDMVIDMNLPLDSNILPMLQEFIRQAEGMTVKFKVIYSGTTHHLIQCVAQPEPTHP